MKNYTLQRFVKLNLYFFCMYSVLTAVWYGINGRFSENFGALDEIFLNAAFFSLIFTISILVWYRRTELRIPVTALSQTALDKALQEIGFLKISGVQDNKQTIYKPAPPKAPVLAGKIFVARSANFYHLQGAKRILKTLQY